MTMVYRPDHPGANENGMVEKIISRPAEAFHVISDGISDTWHPGNGKTYDSKSQFRRATKALGMVELGNEKQTDRRDFSSGDLKRDIGEAIQKVNQGYRPTSEHINYNGDGWTS